MANTGTDALFPEFWALAFDELDVSGFQLHNLVSRDAEAYVQNFGTSVKIPISPDVPTAQSWDGESDIAPTPINQEMADVVLNERKTSSFELKSSELSLSPYKLIETYGIPFAQSLIESVDLKIYEELIKSPNIVNALSSFNEDTLTDMGTTLNKNRVSAMNRNMVINPDDVGTLLKTTTYKLAQNAGTDLAQVEGLIPRKSGFNIYNQLGMDAYTPADVSGLINNGAGYAAGIKTVTVDGFADSAAPVRPGDIFTVAGETGTPYHTVQSTTVDGSSNTVSITFLPALVSSVADNAAITVTPTKSNIGFKPNSIAMAARAEATFPDGQGVKQTVMMLQNLPIRISVSTSGKNLKTQVIFDILFGVKLVNAKRIVRAIRPA